MSGEADFLRRLRAMVADPAARGLMDDAARAGRRPASNWS